MRFNPKAEADIYARILGLDAAVVADAVAEYGGIRNVPEGWQGIRYEQIAGILELMDFYRQPPSTEEPHFHNASTVFQLLSPRLAPLQVEEFHALMLDNKHRLILDKAVSSGTLTQSLVHPRELFRTAVACAAAAVLLVHNHPSGDPTPSVEDIAITRRLVEVGELVGIRVLDHVVIGHGQFISMKEQGYF